MTNSVRGLAVIDVQRDFCEGGSLAVAGATAVAARLNSFLAAERNSGIYRRRIATRDMHVDPGAHFSPAPDFSASWPAHCVEGGEGAQFHPYFHPAVAAGLVDATFHKGAFAAAYSGFEAYRVFGDDAALNGQGLNEYLRGCGITHLDVCGIATDYCVIATIRDAVRLGFETRLIEDASAPVSPEALHAEGGVFAELDSLGVQRVNLRDIL